MKKFITVCICLALAASVACKKKSKDGDASLEKKYAKYDVVLFEDKDLQKRTNTVLYEAEPVDLLGMDTTTDKKKNNVDVAKIQLSEGTVGYIQADILVEKPIVFTQDTKAYVRNNTGSKVHSTIPTGTLGFIMEEKADWVKIFIGHVGDKYIQGQWVHSGYSADDTLVGEAKKLKQCVRILGNQAKYKAEEIQQAKQNLEELKNGSSALAEPAKKKYEELVEKKDAAAAPEENTQPVQQEGQAQ